MLAIGRGRETAAKLYCDPLHAEDVNFYRMLYFFLQATACLSLNRPWRSLILHAAYDRFGLQSTLLLLRVRAFLDFLAERVDIGQHISFTC